jgi:hypothetical protein
MIHFMELFAAAKVARANIGSFAQARFESPGLRNNALPLSLSSSNQHKSTHKCYRRNILDEKIGLHAN